MSFLLKHWKNYKNIFNFGSRISSLSLWSSIFSGWVLSVIIILPSSILLYLIISVVAATLSQTGVSSHDISNIKNLAYIISFIMIVFTLVGNITLSFWIGMIQRFHDHGIPGKFVVLFFLLSIFAPYGNILVGIPMFVYSLFPGQTFKNKWGEPVKVKTINIKL